MIQKHKLLRELKKGDRFQYFGAKFEAQEKPTRSRIYQGASGYDFTVKVRRVDTDQERLSFSPLTNTILDRFDVFIGNYNRTVQNII
jgi:hypothetical protein